MTLAGRKTKCASFCTPGGDCMAQRYLLDSWQSLLQMATNLIGKGYYYWHLTEFPVHKKSKWEEIDNKLISKYKTNRSKWQRQRLKAKDVANFYYLRWENIALILHTPGQVADEIEYTDKFHEIHKEPLILQISELVGIKIRHDEKVSVYLDNEMILGIRATFYNIVKTHNVELIKKEFNRLNGLPAYRGIIQQKANLRRYLVELTKKHGIRVIDKKTGKNRNLQLNDFRMYTMKKTVKNYKEGVEDSDGTN